MKKKSVFVKAGTNHFTTPTQSRPLSSRKGKRKRSRHHAITWPIGACFSHSLKLTHSHTETKLKIREKSKKWKIAENRENHCTMSIAI